MPHRYLCDVLEEMRACYKTRNFASLSGLIEEVQAMGNRLDAALGEKGDYERWRKKRKKEQAELKKLLRTTNALRREAGTDEKEMPTYP